MKLVLDTGVIMLILKGDKKIKTLIKDISCGTEAYTTTINLTELYYKTEQKLGKETAVTWLNRIIHLKDLTIVPVDTELAIKAGKLKAKYRNKISLADAIVAALAEKTKAKLATTDKALNNIEEIEVLTYS